MFKEKLSIIKIGGNIIEDDTSLNVFLKLFSNLEGKENSSAWRWKTCNCILHLN